ncbi:toll-like receptor 6 [Cimex lectularius]|uniref:TIR domain-containing protein n=1 Tax=Cimex lectularius TaxID=79782 RepID=A0A8I6S551_CIMLE|nr:toll-like receptor 6 [Cimex lectularius]
MAFVEIALCAFIFAVSSAIATNEPDCDWERVLSVADEPEVTVSLQCKLRTIGNADSVLSNLTSAQMDMITTLKLECSDVLFFESSLEPNSFMTQLHRLRDLRLEFCKIRYVPAGVLTTSRELKNLVLRTHNTDWSAMTMEFHSDAFRGLTQLKTLDLSDNNIWNLPNELFCPLYSLTHLNMSRNRLQKVLELGFSDWGAGPTAPGKTCNVGLEELDISANEISAIPDNAFTSLRSLQKLLLQDNNIETMADRAFVGLVSLQYLNASSNRLVALPPELFQSTRDLREIYLNNNTINVLAPGLLEGLDQVLVIDLSKNELTSSWVNRDTFSGLVRLVVLNLGHNQLSKIDAQIFQDLYSLQILNLEHNQIECIAEGAFVTLSNLHALTLSHNRLTTIEPFHMAGLYVLNQLFLDHNKIDEIDEKAFKNCSNLHDLGLSGNSLKEVPAGISELRFLETLDLGENRITNIVGSSFQGLDQLYGLRLIDNHIVNVTKDTFSTLPSLQVLNLAYNKIEHVDKSAFGTSSTLHAIRLDGNQLKDINGMFINLPGLVWLNISDNQLQWFDYSLIPQSLEWLDMHKNNVADLGNYFGKGVNLEIKMLDASFNRLTEINENSIPDKVESLLLNDNLIRKVKPGTFQKKANLTRVVLYANQIQTIDLAALRLDPVPEGKELPQFYIGNNPIHCDCTMEWLQRINQLSHLRQHPRVMDLESVTCQLTHSRGSPTKPLMDLKPSQFLCPYETHCFALCHCCDFDACDCEMTCPANCTCYHDHTWSANVVDCSNAGYNTVPTKIPMDATEIYLDGNDLGELGSHVFIGKKKLEVLFLNNSNIDSLHNRTFNGVTSLRVLHMENNHLQELRGFEFDQLENLNELYLDHNEIKHLGNNTFKAMKTLEILKLEANNIVNFEPWEQLSSETLATVSLEGNTWTCACSNINHMEVWLKENTNTLNADKLLCSDGKTTVLDAMKACSEARDTAAATSAVHRNTFYNTAILGEDYIPFVAASLVVFIIILMLTIVGFIFRKNMSLWIHSKYGVRVFGEGSDREDDRLYDAYMVYSVKDEEFVSQVIASSLERSGYSLFLHYRDLHVMSPSYLTDSILGASDAARRIVIVLSLSFLQNEWERPPFRAALQACLERTRSRRSKVILLLTTDVGPDPELQLLLKACKVISWGEKRFWEKLRYAMPDVQRKSQEGLKKVVVEGKGPGGARYTAAPTSQETWYRMSPASLTQSSAPTQSTCVSEESSQRTTDEEEEPHSYVSIDYQQRPPPKVHHHVYSCIPDPQCPQGGRTYFV